jgi:hypothetical protein
MVVVPRQAQLLFNSVFETFVNSFDGALKKVVTSEDNREKIAEALQQVQPTVVTITDTVGKLPLVYIVYS